MDRQYDFIGDRYLPGDHKSQPIICELKKISQPLESIEGFVDKRNFLSNLDILTREFYEKENKSHVISNVEEISSEKPKNPKEVFKSILTNYIVEDINISKSEEALIYLLTKIFDAVFAEYKRQKGVDYRIVFKGGNVIRLYYEDMMNRYFSNLRSEVMEKYGDYFKKSDLDFSVENLSTSYKNLTEEEKIIKKKNESSEILPYIWYILSVARVCILQNIGNLYNLCKFNFFKFEDELKSVLEKISEEINNKNNPIFDGVNFIGLCFNEFTYMKELYDLEDILNNPKNYEYIDIFNKENNEVEEIPKFFVTGNSKRRDAINMVTYNYDANEQDINVFTVDHEYDNIFVSNFLDKPYEEIAFEVLPTQVSEFYLTSTPLIENLRTMTIFRLTRLMINFVAIYEKDNKLGAVSVPSELFDLSISISNSASLSDYVSKDKYYNKYSYSFVDSDGGLVEDEILTTSAYGTLFDIIRILFVEGLPWEDKKYSKRLTRMVFLLRHIELEYEDSYFNTDNILTTYILPLREKINRIENEEERNHASSEYENLIETFKEVNDDIDSYLDRGVENKKYISKIEEFNY